MMSVGETLRQQRLRRKVQLQEVSEELKISSRMLAAIEADEYDKLPGGVFAKNFVRQYAGVLGLDEADAAGRFAALKACPNMWACWVWTRRKWPPSSNRPCDRPS